MLWQARLAAWNFELDWMSAGKIGPLPEKFGLGRLYPCWRTHVTYFVIAVCERRPAKRPPPARNPKLAPQALKAACSFGLFAKPPPPPKNPRRRVVPVPVVPVPDPEALPDPGAPPGGAPAGRDGRVTPCCFRHASSFVRWALFGPRPPAAADAVVLELEPLEPLEPLDPLELLALPQAAIKQPRASATNM
jgi:hypothetical protein